MRRELCDFDRASSSKLNAGRVPGEQLDGF
jgi:hypothetical protein